MILSHFNPLGMHQYLVWVRLLHVGAKVTQDKLSFLSIPYKSQHTLQIFLRFDLMRFPLNPFSDHQCIVWVDLRWCFNDLRGRRKLSSTARYFASETQVANHLSINWHLNHEVICLTYLIYKSGQNHPLLLAKCRAGHCSWLAIQHTLW